MSYVYALDPNCKAVWRFEPGALEVDSMGLVPNLETPEGYTPAVSETGSYKEGEGAVYFGDRDDDTDTFYTISDADLPTGFPLKSGDTEKKFSGTMWFKKGESSGFGALPFGKYYKLAGSSYARCFWLYIYYTYFEIGFGYNNGANIETFTHGTIPADTWVHVAWVVDGVAKTYKIRFYNGSSSTNYTGTLTNELSVTDADIFIGRPAYTGLYLDSFAIFNDLLSDAEIDEIRDTTEYVQINSGQGDIPAFSPSDARLGLLVPSVEIPPFEGGSRQYTYSYVPVEAPATQGCGVAWFEHFTGEGEAVPVPTGNGAGEISPFTGEGVAPKAPKAAFGEPEDDLGSITGAGYTNLDAFGDGDFDPPYDRAITMSARLGLPRVHATVSPFTGFALADVNTVARGARPLAAFTGSAQAGVLRSALADSTVAPFTVAGETCLSVRSQTVAPFTGSAQATQETRALGDATVQAFTGVGRTIPFATGERSLPAFTGSGRCGLQTDAREVSKFTGEGAAASARVFAGSADVLPFTGSGSTFLTASGSRGFPGITGESQCGLQVDTANFPPIEPVAVAARARYIEASGSYGTITGAGVARRLAALSGTSEMPDVTGSGQALKNVGAGGISTFPAFVQGPDAANPASSGESAEATQHSRFDGFVLRFVR